MEECTENCTGDALFWEGMTLANTPHRYASAKYWKESFVAYLYLLPAFVILGLFNFYPVVKSLYMSLFDWNLVRLQQYFVGLENYQDLFRDQSFRQAILTTIYYVAGYVPLTIGVGLFIAVLLNSKIKLRGIYRLAFFIPWITSPVAASMVWRWIFNHQYGLLNLMMVRVLDLANSLIALLSFGFIQEAFPFSSINWLMDPSWTVPNLIMISAWKYAGYNVVIFLAGLQNVPSDLYEAAEVDGASGWQKFWKVTLPLISPTTFFVSIISIIGAFKLFTEIFVLYVGRPGPLESGMTMVFYVYRMAFERWQMGYASAGAYVLFGIIFIFTLIQLRAAKNRVHYA